MDIDALMEKWKHEEEQPFSGWDFSYLDGRMQEEQPGWSYSGRAIELLRQASSVVDLDTGGGEQFLNLREYWPLKVVATEHYPPNYKLATGRLSPLGVTVLDVKLGDFAPMPFADGEFDLVLNRHAAFNPDEVGRVLTAGGTFLTQQVHGLSTCDLLAAFEARPQWPDSTPAKYIPRLEAAGLTIITCQEWSGALVFSDVGAVVYYLKAIPWLVPGFSVKTHWKYLLTLQEQWKKQEMLSFTSRKYLIEAHKLA